MSLLSVQNLSKKYRKREVVRDVSITVNSGEIVGLLGPNGAGKTTSFHMVVGLITCDKGKIFINDHDIVCQRYQAALEFLKLAQNPERF